MAKKPDRPAKDFGGSIGRTAPEHVELDPLGRPIVAPERKVTRYEAQQMARDQRTATRINDEDASETIEPAPAAGPNRNDQQREADQAAREAESTRLNELVQLARNGNERVNNTQLNARNAIADRMDAVRGVTEDYLPDPTEEAAAAEDTESEAARAALEAEAAAVDAGATAEPIEAEQEPEAELKKYSLNINGREVQLTEAEVLARAQKVASADEYLQTAAEALKRSQPPTPSDEDVPANVEQDDVEATLTSALMGDKEAIKAVAKRLQAPPVSQTDVLKAVDDKLSFRSAVDWFKAEYADVTSDPMLYKLVVDRDAELAKTQPTLGYRDRLKSAGDTVRTWRDKIKGPPPAAPPPNPKLARKAAVAPVPQASASARSASAAQDEDVDEPVESIIDKMAKARHQPGAIRNGSRQ